MIQLSVVSCPFSCSWRSPCCRESCRRRTLSCTDTHRSCRLYSRRSDGRGSTDKPTDKRYHAIQRKKHILLVTNVYVFCAFVMFYLMIVSLFICVGSVMICRTNSCKHGCEMDLLLCWFLLFWNIFCFEKLRWWLYSCFTALPCRSERIWRRKDRGWKSWRGGSRRRRNWSPVSQRARENCSHCSWSRSVATASPSRKQPKRKATLSHVHKPVETNPFWTCTP